MPDELFQCRACGQPVTNPAASRFLLSRGRPAVCERCGAPHFFEFGVQIDGAWLRERMDELAHLKREQAEDRSRGLVDAPDSTDESPSRRHPAARSAPTPPSGGYRRVRDGERDDHSAGSQH